MQEKNDIQEIIDAMHDETERNRNEQEKKREAKEAAYDDLLAKSMGLEKYPRK